MFATWILCLFLLMIAPYLTLEAGILRKKKCAALGRGPRLSHRAFHGFSGSVGLRPADLQQTLHDRRHSDGCRRAVVHPRRADRYACKPVCVHRRHRVVRGGHGHSADRIGGNQPSQAFRAQNGRLICPFLHSFLHKQSPNDFKTVRALPVCFL